MAELAASPCFCFILVGAYPMTTFLSANMSDRLSRAQRSRQLFDEAIECPKCGKHSVVRRSPNVFDCINCSFHKELPPVATSASLPSARLPRHSLPVQSLLNSPRLSHPDLSLEDSPRDKTHPLVFAALMVIIGILFL